MKQSDQDSNHAKIIYGYNKRRPKQTKQTNKSENGAIESKRNEKAFNIF